MGAGNSFISRFTQKNSVREIGTGNQFAVFVPLKTRPVGDQSKKTAVQIARGWFCVPAGFQFLFSVRPELRPRRRVVFQIVLPAPDNFPVRRPKTFRAGFASIFINDFMLLCAILVKICFVAVEQIASVRTNPRAPLRTHFSIRIIFRKLFHFAAGIFGRDVASVRPNPRLV